MPDPEKKIPSNENYVGYDNSYLNKLTESYLKGEKISQMPRQLYNVGQSDYDEGFIIPETTGEIDAKTMLADWRGAKQSGWEQAGLGIIRTLTKAGSEVIKTPGYLVSGIEGIVTGDFNKAMDNAYLNAIDNVEESIKNELAVYIPKEVREGGLGAALSSTSFWATEGADAVGYLLGMMGGSGAIKGLNIPGKLMSSNKFVNLASKLPGAATAAGVAGNIELGTMTLVNSMAESVAESRGVVKDLQSTLRQADPNTGQRAINPKTGQPWTDEEIDTAAGEAGRNSFYMNMGVLMVPNMIMNKNLFGRFNPSKRAIDELTDEAGNLIAHNPLTRKQIVGQYLSSMGKSMASEGLFEEGSQTAIENYVKKQATHQIDEDWLTGTISEYADMLGTTEGQKSILLGSILGGLGGARGRYRDIKAQDEYKGKVSQILQKNFQGFTQLADVFEKDENGKVVMEENDKGELKPKINIEKATDFITTAIKEQNAGTMQDVLGMIGDKEGYERSFNQAFMRFAMPYLNLEGGEEVLMKQIDGMSDQLKTINEATGSNISDMQFTTNLKERVKELSKQTKFVQDQVARASAVLGNQDPEQVTKFTDRLVNAAIGEVGDQMLLREQLRTLDRDMAQMKAHPDAGAVYMQDAIAQQQEKIDSILMDLKESDDLYKGLFDPNEIARGFNEFVSAKENLKTKIDTYTQAVNEGRVEEELANESKPTEEKHISALDKFYAAENVDELNDAVKELKESPLMTPELRAQIAEDYANALKSFARKEQINQIVDRKEQVYNDLTNQIKQARESIEEKEVEAEILQEDYDSGKTKLSEKGLAKKINDIDDAIKQLEDFIANAEAQRDQILAEVEYYGTEAAMDMDLVQANRDAKRRSIEDINKRIDESKGLLDRLKKLLKDMTAVWNKVFPNKKANLEKGRWEYIDAKSQIDLKKSDIAEINNQLAELEDIKAELAKQEKALTDEIREFNSIMSSYNKGREVVDTELDEQSNNSDDIEIEQEGKVFDPVAIKPISIAFSSSAGNNMVGNTDEITKDPDQLRWFRYTSQLKFNKNLGNYKLMAVTKNSNPYGDKVKFRDTEKGEDIVLILTKDNNPVVVDGELVFTSMWGEWTLDQAKNRFSNPSNMTDGVIQTMLNNHKKLRETIKASKDPIILPVLGLTPGIRVIDDTKDPEGRFIYKFPVAGRIVESNDQLDTIEMEVATTNTVTVGNYQVDAVPGMVYVKTNGQVVPMRVSKLGEIDNATSTVVSLIKQLRETTSPTFKGDRVKEFKRIYNEINKITLFANTKADNKYKIFMSKDGRLYYNGKYHNVINEEDLTNFLADKYFRVSNKLLKANEKKFKDPISKKVYPSYKHYLMSNEGRVDNQVPVGTDLVGNTNQQFLNVGLVYNNQAVAAKTTKEEKPIITGTGLASEKSPRRTTTVDDEEFGTPPPEGLSRLPQESSPRRGQQVKPTSEFTFNGQPAVYAYTNKSTGEKMYKVTSEDGKKTTTIKESNLDQFKGTTKPTITEETQEEVIISAPALSDERSPRVLFSEETSLITDEEAEEIEDQTTKESVDTQSLVDKLNNLDSTDTGDDFPGMNRLYIGEEAATEAELDAEEEWFRANFPQIEYTRLKNLIDGKAVGKFLASGRILISQLAAKGTTYHEAFHVVSQLFLTDKERTALYKEYKERTGKDLTNDQTEEALAEDFRAYMIGEKLSFGPRQKGFFRRLLDAIKALLGIGQPNIEDIFEKIKKGAYKSSKPLVDKNNGAKNYYAEIPGKDTAWTKDFMDSMSVFFFKHLMKGNNDWSIENLFDTSNKAFIGSIYERVKNDFIETYKKLPSEYQKLVAEDYNFILAPTLSQNEQNRRWNMLVNAHSKYLSKFGIEIKFKDNIDEIDPDSNVQGQRDDYEDNIPEAERTTKDNTYIDAINFSTKDKMPKSVKLLIASLPHVEMKDGKPKIVVNRFGTPAGTDFNRTMDWMHNKLANISDLNDMINTISQLSEIRPELKVLLGYMKIDTSNNLPVTLNFDQARLVVQFWQQFAKTKNTYYTALIDDIGNFLLVDSNSQRFKTKIQDQWSNAMKDSANKADGVYMLNPDGRIVLNPGKLQKLSLFTNTNNISSIIDFFNELGITFSTNKWNAITDYRKWEEDNKVKGVLKPEAKELVDEIGILLNAYAKIKDFVIKNENIESLFQKDLIKGSMDSLAELEGKYNKNITESQHLSPDRKTVYDITLNTFLSNVINRINRYGIESISHLNRKNNIYTRGSLFYDLLLDGKKLDLVVLSGMKINEPGEEGELTNDLKLGDFYLQSLNAVLGNNIQFLRAADKKLEYAFHMDFDLSNEEYEEQLIRYFYDDIVRSMELVQNGVGSDIQNYKDNAKRSLIFENIFKDNPKLKYDPAKIKNADSFIRKNREAILDAIRKWSNEQINKKSQEFFNKGIYVAKGDKFMIKGIDSGLLTEIFGEPIDTTEDTFTADEILSIVRTIHNKFTIGAIEQIKLFTGDLAFFKNSSDFNKRTGGLTGPKKLSLVGSAINAYINSNMKRKDGKIADDKINVLVYNDVKAVSEYLNEYKEAIGAKADKYESYDEADAQGLVTLDEYREMMFRAGDWTPQQNEAYKKAINGETLTTDEIALFPPLKPQHYGPRTDANGKLYIPTYYKFSLMPLIPSALKGRQLEKLMNYMSDNKIGLVMFASANKVGNNINQDFYDANGNINLPGKDVIGDALQEVDYTYMGIQVDNAPIEKTKVTVGTQFRALILSNLFTKGLGKVIKYLDSKTGKEVSKNTKEIANEYNETINELTDIEWNGLLDRLTLTKDANGDYKIGDIEVFKDILITEAEDRAVAYNLVDYINRSLSGDVKAVDFTLSKNKIENLLYSMVNNKVIRQKTNGDMKILAASTGFEMQARKFKTLPDGVKKILGNDVLKFYTQSGPGGTTTKMQVLLPWYYKELYKDADLKDIDTSLFNLVGFRTPTEGYKNIDAIEVVGFLPKEVGNMVVVPSEIVVKSGSDYDVDKLTLFIPNNLKVGKKYKYIPTSDKGLKKLYDEWVDYYNNLLTNVQREIEETGERYSIENDPELTLAMAVFGDDTKRAQEIVNALINKESNLKKKAEISFEEFKKNLRKKQLQNKVIEIANEVLSSPDIFSQLITPTSTDTLKNLASEIVGIRGAKEETGFTTVIQFINNAKKALEFWTGKGGVGIIALHNKSHTLAQQANLSMPGLALYFGKDGKPLYNTVDDTVTGDVSLAGDYDATGTHRISDILAELLNSYLDVAKDPFVLNMNAAINTSNVWAMLIRAGVPIRSIAIFMNQPIIWDYLTEQSINETMLKKATQDKANKVLTKAQIVQKTMNKYNVSKVKARKSEEYVLIDANRLESMVKPDVKKDNDFYIDQLQILDNFLSYQTSAKDLSDLQKALSNDTAGAGKNRNEARSTMKLLNNLIEKNAFNGIDEYINNTMLKGFHNVVKESQNMYNEMFVTDMPKSREALKPIEDYIDELGFTADTAAELMNLAENEFISYLLQTVKSDNKFLSQEIDSLFKGKDSLPKKMLEIKRNKKHPLYNNAVIQELFPVIRGTNMTDILKRFNRQMNTYEQNIFVDAFKEINETNPALAMQIVKFGIIQSGLNNSPITFNSLIPSDLFFAVANPILKQYVSSDNIDIGKFTEQFLLNNYSGIAAKLVRKVKPVDGRGIRIPLKKKDGSDNSTAKYHVLKTFRNTAPKNQPAVWETKLYVKVGGDENTATYAEAPLLGDGMNIHRYYPTDVFNRILAHNNSPLATQKPSEETEDDVYEPLVSDEIPPIFNVNMVKDSGMSSPRAKSTGQLRSEVSPRAGGASGKLSNERSPRASSQAGKQEYRLLPDRIKANLAKAGISEKVFNSFNNQEQQNALKCHG